ncbi:MAG: type II toxin-antitoxin system PemK/MazF family toxin [Clostridia bacterium]|nr:type II toxin-antitoxin system PemK/MazF family toxin [Clostridia bacterium]
MLFEIGEIFWLEVSYEDIPNESKVRPAIIIGKSKDNSFILVSTTSQAPSEPPSHFDQYKIPIYNWRRLGFPKSSWALGYRLIELDEKKLKSIIKKDDYIGYMDEIDLQCLNEGIKRIHN